MFPGGKGGRCIGLSILSPSCADCLKIWEPQPPGTLTACQAYNGLALALLLPTAFVLYSVRVCFRKLMYFRLPKCVCFLIKSVLSCFTFYCRWIMIYGTVILVAGKYKHWDFTATQELYFYITRVAQCN
jgi:hypothetical protein